MNPKGLNVQTPVKPWNRMRELTEALSCPLCGEENVSTAMTCHEFDYGSGDSLVKLRARVPARRCGSCGFEYLDDRAERLKHKVVWDHLLSCQGSRDA